MSIRHTPVMPNEVVEYLKPESGSALIIDGTLGEGGHSQFFLEKNPNARLVGIDADPVMADRASKRLSPLYGDRVECRVGWNDELLADWQGDAPGVVFVDLGISAYHYEEGGRGFSFASSDPLDMRIDKNGELRASDIVNSFHENELADLIYKYGEERYSRRIARRIVEQRKRARIMEASKLAEIVSSAVPKQARHGRIHPATRTFQALRIAVNNELDRLSRLLESVPEILMPGGKFGVICFHSLEDREVKKSFRYRQKQSNGMYENLFKKPLVPTMEECRKNPPSRSAKFRILRRRGSGEAV